VPVAPLADCADGAVRAHDVPAAAMMIEMGPPIEKLRRMMSA
jgi:hypothetical protein